MADRDDGALNDKEHLCRRCGLCCHEKVRIGDQVVITDIPCRHLDPETNLCRIYEDRARLEPRCLSAEVSAKGGGLPGDCPYVAELADYRAPHLLWEHPEYEDAINSVYPERAKKEGPPPFRDD